LFEAIHEKTISSIRVSDRYRFTAGFTGGESDQMNAATKILDAWHNDQLEPAERFLHIVCWTLIKGWDCAELVPACQ
jgi:hypothetical protein